MADTASKTLIGYTPLTVAHCRSSIYKYMHTYDIYFCDPYVVGSPLFNLLKRCKDTTENINPWPLLCSHFLTLYLNLKLIWNRERWHLQLQVNMREITYKQEQN